MFSRIKRWIYSKLFLFDDEVSHVVRKINNEKSCTRDVATRKRIAKAFEQQEKQIKTRAMKAHGPDCLDPLGCKKRICFKQIPDKIIES